MAVLNREDFFAKLNTMIGDDTSEDALSFIEDVTDTYNELEGRATNGSDGEDWRTRYEENDKAWRKKYRDRFFTTPEEVIEEQEENVEDDGEKRSFEELFEEREG